MNNNQSGLKIVAVIFCILSFVGVFIFLNKNRQANKDIPSTTVGQNENLNEFRGSVELIAEKSVTVKLSDQDKESEMNFGVDGATPVVILNDKKEETVAQMADLEWRDYVIVQYDSETKAANKISIVR